MELSRKKDSFDAMKKYVPAVILASMMLSSCLKENSYPIEPVLTFQELRTFNGDSARLILGFTDGDGDFGLNDGDTLSPNFCGTCPYHQNLILDYYELQNGDWTEVEPALPFNVRVPYLQPTGQDKSQAGNINVLMLDYYLDTPFDTFKFVIKGYDRALHESNQVETSAYVKSN
jgi:hypothetical protein